MGDQKLKNYMTDIRSITGVNVNRCYQCGKCSAGCSVAQNMDFAPSRIMRMLQTANVDEYSCVLRSEAIWLCLSCQNCFARCPMEINLPLLMDFLRTQSAENKMVNKRAGNIVAFHKAFLDSIKFTGRLYEIGLVVGYKLRTRKLLQDVLLAPSMLAKGKLPILPEHVKDMLHVKKLFSRMKGDV